MKRLTISEQTYEFLKNAIAEGRWSNRLPGERKLAAELKVARLTLKKALVRLQEEGLIPAATIGCRRRMIATGSVFKKRPVRIGLLRTAYESESEQWRREFMEIIRDIETKGYVPVVAHHAATAESPKINRLAKLIGETDADAWILFSAPRQVLEYFEKSCRVPVLANGGPSAGLMRLASAGYRIGPGLFACARRLLDLGHTRIVLLAPERFLKPQRAATLTAYLEFLKQAGIKAGEYHVPVWTESPEGLESLLQSLFQVTPPTALIVWNVYFAAGVQGFLARRRLRIPEDVSLIVMETGPVLHWYHPGIRPTRFDNHDAECLRNIARWVDRIASGEHDRSVHTVDASLVEGSTLAPPRRDT